ncbi:MAG: acetate--CoA ligase [Oligoflexales bacterium]
MENKSENISNILKEHRYFIPPKEFASNAYVDSLSKYEDIWQSAHQNSESYWQQQAENLHWYSPFTEVFKQEQDYHFKWFLGGVINACYNCVDRHLPSKADKVAIYWEGEPGDTKEITYRELHKEVCKVANSFKRLGVKVGDVVTFYMPMVPELTIGILACARIGVMHNVVFAGFSSDSLISRLTDAKSRFVVTADGVFRKGKKLPLKDTVDACHKACPWLEKVIVLERTGQKYSFNSANDLTWQDFIKDSSELCEAPGFDSEHPLFLLYTSGSTGKPKGILHTTAGYLLGAAVTSKYIFDLKDDDIYWCTADIGWITGHSYCIYGPFALGVSTLMYEGAPNTPDWGRFWQLIEKYKVSKFYTAPTAIRSFIKYGPEIPKQYDLSSLKLLGTVGEPINPEAWMWYQKTIGKGQCPIVDSWWQTETGSIMIAGLPGATNAKPGSATRPFFGIAPQVVDEQGKQVDTNQGGYLVISKPWPSMMRTIYGDHDRFKSQYWEKVPGKYFTGDGARIDEDGDIWIMGRIDDVLNVSGHRLSTMEIESSLVSHKSVAEAAVVGKPDELKGEAICCFVTLKNGIDSQKLAGLLKQHVCEHIGALARPDSIIFTDTLPKTRSGKIMRRLLRDIASGRRISGDTSTLENIAAIKQFTEIPNQEEQN